MTNRPTNWYEHGLACCPRACMLICELCSPLFATPKLFTCQYTITPSVDARVWQAHGPQIEAGEPALESSSSSVTDCLDNTDNAATVETLCSESSQDATHLTHATKPGEDSFLTSNSLKGNALCAPSSDSTACSESLENNAMFDGDAEPTYGDSSRSANVILSKPKSQASDKDSLSPRRKPWRTESATRRQKSSSKKFPRKGNRATKKAKKLEKKKAQMVRKRLKFERWRQEKFGIGETGTEKCSSTSEDDPNHPTSTMSKSKTARKSKSKKAEHASRLKEVKQHFERERMLKSTIVRQACFLPGPNPFDGGRVLLADAVMLMRTGQVILWPIYRRLSAGGLREDQEDAWSSMESRNEPLVNLTSDVAKIIDGQSQVLASDETTGASRSYGKVVGMTCMKVAGCAGRQRKETLVVVAFSNAVVAYCRGEVGSINLKRVWFEINAEATVTAINSEETLGLVMAGTSDGRVLIWNALLGQRVATLSLPLNDYCQPTGRVARAAYAVANRAVSAVRVCALSRVIFASDGGGFVGMWQLSSLQRLWSCFSVHKRGITVTAVEPLQRLRVLVSGGPDGNICIWKLPKRQVTTQPFHRKLRGHDSGIIALRVTIFFVASADSGGEVKLWGLSGDKIGRCLRSLRVDPRGPGLLHLPNAFTIVAGHPANSNNDSFQHLQLVKLDNGHGGQKRIVQRRRRRLSSSDRSKKGGFVRKHKLGYSWVYE